MIDIVLIAIIVFCGWCGAKRGFARSLIGVISTFLSLIVGVLIMHPVSLLLYNSAFSDIIREYVSVFFEQNLQGRASLFINSQSNIEGLTILVINAISFILVIILAKIVVSLLARIVNIAAHLPIIKQANSILGMALGCVSGFIICYIIIGVSPLLGGQSQSFFKMIEESFLCSALYDNNLITKVLTSFVK